jgi:hypothetical protein
MLGAGILDMVILIQYTTSLPGPITHSQSHIATRVFDH